MNKWKEKPKKTHYAVARGRKVGIFETWDEVVEVTRGVAQCWYKGFYNREDAEEWLKTEEVRVIEPGEFSHKQKEQMRKYGVVIQPEDFPQASPEEVKRRIEEAKKKKELEEKKQKLERVKKEFDKLTIEIKRLEEELTMKA